MSDTYHDTERVYDEQMAPLVTQLINIAKASNIPLFLSAGMILRDGTAGCCTTLIGPDLPVDPLLKGVSNRLLLCSGIVRGHRGFDTAAGLVISRHHPVEVGGE